MEKQVKTRICFFALSALLVVFMVGETLAYDWTQIEQVTNEFETGVYDTSLIEEFESPDVWLPGQYTNKDVSVTNDGSVPVFVKIEVSQEWLRTANVYDADGNVVVPEAGETFDLTFDTDGDGTLDQFAALVEWGSDVVVLASGSSSSLSLGLPVVDSVEDAYGKWLLVEESADGAYVFYYIGVLESGAETSLLIEGVEMNPLVQSSTLSTSTVWDADTESWVTTSVENSSYDYENSTYTLRVTMSTVQATEAAVSEIFGFVLNDDDASADLEMFSSSSMAEQGIISYLQNIAVSGEDVSYSRDDVDQKMLYLSEVDGELTYTPATPEENWFMSFFNMMPGESYTDSMTVANLSDSTYDIYMQAILKDVQSDIADELLGYIYLEVYHNGELIYEGTADGKSYDNALFDVIYLGSYEASDESLLEIVVTLDKDLSTEYADILTNTDWQFMVEENPEDEKAEETDEAGDSEAGLSQTGDARSLAQYLLLMVLSGLALLGSIYKIRSSYKS